MANPRFTQASLDFITLASRQKKTEWLDKNRSEYEDKIVHPMKHLMDAAGQALKPHAPGYRFPTRNVARLKRGADNAKLHGPFRDWIHVSVSRDSESRYESLPNLFFTFAEGHEEIFSAGGLYMPSADQTKHIRSWIDKDPSQLEDLLVDRKFKKIYKSLGDERKLKTKPRDYPLEHPRIDMLKLSGWYVWRPFTKKQFFSKEFSTLLIEDWAQVLRLNRVLDSWTASWPKSSLIEALPVGRKFQDDWDD
jgi:uncharacterized protein (TIGR02453 family)